MCWVWESALSIHTTVNQNQATKSNRNLTNYQHQSRPAHSSASSSQSGAFMLDYSTKMHQHQCSWRKPTVTNEGLAAFQSRYCLSRKCHGRWDKNPPSPHSDIQYMISHFSVGEQTINTGLHKKNTHTHTMVRGLKADRCLGRGG